MIVDRGIEGNLNFSQCQYHDQQNRRICKCNMHMVVSLKYIFVMRCAIWYHLYNLKNVKNTHGRVLLLVKLQALLLKVTLIPRFLNCTNSSTLCNVSHLSNRFSKGTVSPTQQLQMKKSGSSIVTLQYFDKLNKDLF